MQVSRFHNGGYVVHKITGPWSGSVSAWFNAEGDMIDAEQITTRCPGGKRVNRRGSVWKIAETIGRRFAPVYSKIA